MSTLAASGSTVSGPGSLSKRAGGSLHGIWGPPASAFLIAVQTACGVDGIGMWRTPRCDTASTTALCTAGIAPIVPDSPIPFAPSGFRCVGVTVFDVSKLGNSAALGIA